MRFAPFRLDGDFRPQHPCAARRWMPAWQRFLLDLVCRLIGHNIWRTNGLVDNPSGSLPLSASYCRRCYKGGFILGDYWRDVTAEVSRQLAVELRSKGARV